MLTVPALVQHFIFFFFFQAEDGIRDGHVTGVQTCALPIYDTVLRRVKVPSSATLSSNPPDVLSVDDWAWRKGHTYITILVDLEQHCVVDLLPCRSAESFEAWLKEQPRIGVISRDRSGLYAEGARLGSPAAMQVADRFHLLLNLSAAVERALEERSRQLQLPFPAPPPHVSLAQDSPQAKNDPARFSQTAAAAAPPRPLRTSYRAVSSGMFAEEDQ